MAVSWAFPYPGQSIVVALLQPVLLALQPEGVHAGRKLRVLFGDPDGLAIVERLPPDAVRRGAAAKRQRRRGYDDECTHESLPRGQPSLSLDPP
jgi:hypothetical protein